MAASLRSEHRSMTRRTLLGVGSAAVGAFALPSLIRASQQTTATPSPIPSADDLLAIARQIMDEQALNATLLHVAIDGKEIVTGALGESMTGVPATPEMRFRNGAVAISLMSTLMLTLVDDGTIRLDDPIGDLVPGLPDTDTATFRMLANMTAGYRDHVQNTDFLNALQDDPFRAYTPEELIEYSLAQPRLFAPGGNWEYSHTNYVILGLCLEAVTGQSVEQLMQDRVLGPLGLADTVNDATGQMPEPALHAFTSERRTWLGIAPDRRFFEESTYWNPSWTLTRGAVQTTSIRDFAQSMVGVGEGTLLSPESRAAQLDRGLIGFGMPMDGCNSCRTFTDRAVYGLGVWMIGPWLLQNPLFSGYSGVSAYLPERKLSIAIANTYSEAAFDAEGNYSNVSMDLFSAIAAMMAPDLNEN